MRAKKPKHRIVVQTFRNRHKADIQTFQDVVNYTLDNVKDYGNIGSKLNITIKLHNGPLKDHGVECDGLTWNEGKELFIRVNGQLPFLDILSTITHETVHAIQIATGTLRMEEDGWYWKEKFYGDSPYTGEEDVDNQLPWEYDAYSLDVELARNFVKKHYSNW